MEVLIKFGKKMVAQGLAASQFGNLSKRVGDRLFISKRGSMLDDLEGEIIDVSLKEEGPQDHLASSELVVHRAIYEHTPALAILHGHSPFAVILSLLFPKEKTLVPRDEEGASFLNEIHIIEGMSGSSDLARVASLALRDHKGIIVRGHGSFARGKTAQEAFVTLSSVENSCKILYFLNLSKF